jgi:alanine dehydrogenase
VDVSIDTGGCFETQKWSHEKPTFIKSNVVHYCSFLQLKQLHLPSVTLFLLLMQIAEDGGLESAIRCDVGLKHGVYFYHGTWPSHGDWFDLPNNDINLIVF